MANANKSAFPAVPIGLMAFLAAAISAVSYYATGHWPAQLGGWGVVLFVLFGVGVLLVDRRESN